MDVDTLPAGRMGTNVLRTGQRQRRFAAVLPALASLLLAAPGAVAQEPAMGAAAALEADAILLAQQKGLPFDDVWRAVNFQRAFADYVDDLAERHPNEISAVWTEPVPVSRGNVRFTSEVPDAAVRELERRGLASNVDLAGGAMIAMDEHAERARLAAAVLVELGYDQHVTFYDPVAGAVRIELNVFGGKGVPSAALLAGAIEDRARGRGLSGRAARVLAGDLRLLVIESAEPIVRYQDGRGGVWAADSSSSAACTIGWPVSGPDGDGFITAAHCVSMDTFEVPGDNWYDLEFERQVFNWWGDVEYHTAQAGVAVVAEFYASSSSIREVNGMRTITSMPGNAVCVYGRASNSRNCAHDVEAISVTTTLEGRSVSNLVRTDNATTVDGDSGGGWSFGTTAWGVHSAMGGTKSYFTPVYIVPLAIFGVIPLMQ